MIKKIVKISLVVVAVVLLQAVGLMQFDGMGAMAEPVGSTAQAVHFFGAGEQCVDLPIDGERLEINRAGGGNRGCCGFGNLLISKVCGDSGESIEIPERSVIVLNIPVLLNFYNNMIYSDQDACAPPARIVYTG
ncbi:MAG: hypothetical protein NC924_07175 [Candidatus Omnitrophica bacterium]|nr:hypothetical protein [Candidatus Omnitrophota bacterium]